MSLQHDLTGQRFGKWVVLHRAEKGEQKGTNTYWMSRCDCGTVKAVVGTSLKRAKGGSKSCGCAVSRSPRSGGTGGMVHGMHHTRIYKVWMGMRSRCRNPKSAAYDRYGGRGITVCERWDSFANFYADMGDIPTGMTLERKDVNGNYEPSNCIWASYEDQNNNQARSRKYLVDGEWRTRTQLMRYWDIAERECLNRVRDYPMLVDRVRFEPASESDERHRAGFEESGVTPDLRRYTDGSYKNKYTRACWATWLRAKQDMSTEPKEAA